jgi:GntR family histidine utilization transcriptional repressor
VFFTIFVFHPPALIPCVVDIAGRWETFLIPVDLLRGKKMSEPSPNGVAQHGVTRQALSELAAAMSDTPAPIYQRVKQAIIGQIRSGAWKPHQRIPSESELVNEIGVSRMTINRALRELTSEGFLIRMQGVGTFVAEAKAYTPMLEVHNIADEIAQRGHRHDSKILVCEAREADADQAMQLGSRPATPCLFADRPLRKQCAGANRRPLR